MQVLLWCVPWSVPSALRVKCSPRYARTPTPGSVGVLWPPMISRRLSSSCSSGGGPVAGDALGSAVAGAVVVVVSEVPGLSGLDGSAAAGAADGAGFDDGPPVLAEVAVGLAVAAGGAAASLLFVLAGVCGAHGCWLHLWAAGV